MSPVHRTAAPSGRRPAGSTPRAAGPAPAPAAARLGLDGRTRPQRTCLHLPHDLPLGDWLRVGRQLLAVLDSSAWWAGDWLVFGSASYPQRYRTAIESTALDYQTLRNYAWVARKFAPSRRRPELSFQHHQEVAALPPEQQDRWLDQAVEHGWSKAELRRRLRAGRAGAAAPAERPARLSLEVAPDRWEVWRQAAEREQQEVAEWLTALADRAVGCGP
ncbi:LmbU family transcriptional regulator [Kitasatospora sp. NPDC093558]|uniref:LmbU family transcriptional regulator n=1 Tax=Kitasatospora sp. NPDC093558 TaxID=3155201 RepID=UPI003449C6EB